MKALAVPKLLRLPLLLGIPVLALLLALWLAQQHNVNSLDQQLDALQRQIETLPATVAPKDKLALEKDRLSLEQGRVNAQNAIYGTIIQALGGAFFVVTAYFTYRNVRATEANVKAAEEKQVTERFSKAIELLGSDKLEVRLGGIYALERIAKDSPKDYWTIIEVLASFVREKSPLQPKTNGQEKKPQSLTDSSLNKQNSSHVEEQETKLEKVATDVQAVLTVIGRRDASNDPDLQVVDLRKANLERADLWRANLERVDFTEANLARAYLVEANLARATLMEANLEEAILVEANFEEAKLVGANLARAELVEANLMGANLRNANLVKAHLTDAILMEADITKADLSGADFSGANDLVPELVKDATRWEEAFYDEEFRKKLGLPPEEGSIPEDFSF